MVNIEVISHLFHGSSSDLTTFGVRSLAIFGSVARGQNTEDSDLDILVEFDRSVGLFEFIRLKTFLEKLTNCRVDLVTLDAIRPVMRENILSEAIYVS